MEAVHHAHHRSRAHPLEISVHVVPLAQRGLLTPKRLLQDVLGVPRRQRVCVLEALHGNLSDKLGQLPGDLRRHRGAAVAVEDAEERPVAEALGNGDSGFRENNPISAAVISDSDGIFHGRTPALPLGVSVFPALAMVGHGGRRRRSP